jgi:TolB-like protein
MLLGLSRSGAAADAAPLGKIAVMDLRDNGVGADVAALLTGQLTHALAELRLFEVISREDIRTLLLHEADRNLLGCSDDDCLLNLGGILNAQYVVAGSAGRVGERWVIGLQLLDISAKKVVRRVERDFSGGHERLLSECAVAAHQVVADILRAESGSVWFTVSEEGADVSVDNALVGTTPLMALNLPAGPHDIRVSRKGFIDWVRTIQVRPREVQQVEVTLIPSARFVEEYETGARRTRRWAWIAAATFAAFEGTALALRIYTWRTYDPIEQRYQDETYEPSHPDRLSYYQAHKDDMRTAEIMDNTALGLALGGVLAGGASLYLFLTGDDPGRYRRFQAGSGSAPSLRPSISLAPGAWALRWNF